MGRYNAPATFTYPHEAHIAKVTLDTEGIEVLIKDESTKPVNNYYSNAIGGIKLEIPSKLTSIFRFNLIIVFRVKPTSAFGIKLTKLMYEF
jgi:hypothetical protein